jgi:hypothetical protein
MNLLEMIGLIIKISMIINTINFFNDDLLVIIKNNDKNEKYNI